MKKPKNIPTYYTSIGTPIYRDTTAVLFNNGGDKKTPPTSPTKSKVYGTGLHGGEYLAKVGPFIGASFTPKPRTFKEYANNPEAAKGTQAGGMPFGVKGNVDFGIGRKGIKAGLSGYAGADLMGMGLQPSDDSLGGPESSGAGILPRFNYGIQGNITVPIKSAKAYAEKVLENKKANEPVMQNRSYDFVGDFKNGGVIKTSHLLANGGPENSYIYTSGGLINNYNTRGTMNFKSNNVQYNMRGNLYAAGGSFNNPGFSALPIEVQNKIRANSYEAGGTMDQLTEFNAGGTHEENPLGGIPQGMSPDGRLNLVEQGETKLKATEEGGGNFVYSDSIKVDRQFAEEFSLPNSYIGKTYAEASKLANRSKSRRENDTIEQTDIKRKLDSLAEAQEAQKAKEQQEQTAQELAANPQLLNALMGQLSANQSVQPMGMPQGEEVSPDQVPPEMLAQMEGAQQGMPIMRCGGHMYICGGKMYDFGGWMEDNSGAVSGAATGFLSGAATGAALGPAGALIGGTISAFAGGVSGHKKDKAKQDAENAAKQQQPAQGMEMQRMQDPTYVTPAAQYALNAGAGTGATYPYMAKQGGPLYHEYPQLNPMWKNNAGPMGQGLANTQVYAMGGHMMAEGGPGNPPIIASYNPTLDPSYTADYKRRLKEYNANPIDPKTGAPFQGSGGEDAGSTGTGGNYRPLTAGERASRIAEFESYGVNDLRPDVLEQYLTLKNNKPFFVASAMSSKTLYAPYDLTKYNAPSSEELSKLYPPAAAAPEPVGYVMSANTGQLMPGRSSTDNAGNNFIEDRQYSQYLEEAANSPEAIAKRQAIEQKGARNQNIISQLSQEQLQEMRSLKMTPENYAKEKGIQVLPFGQTGSYTFDNGGTINTFNPSLMSTEDSTFTRQLTEGGDKDYSDEARAADQMTLKMLKAKVDNGETLTDIEINEYQSALQRLNENLDATDTDFGIKVKPIELAAMAAPVAYNIGTGLFEPAAKLNPEDYTVKGEITPYQYNIVPELREADYGFAAGQEGLRNASTGSAYLSNLQGLYNSRNKYFSDLYTKKQNLDAENYQAAQQANLSLQKSNADTRLQLENWNAQAEAAKRKNLQTGLEQAADIGKTFVDMRGQQALVKAYAPDYADTLRLLLDIK